jgi:hypothetical protein
MGKTVPTTWSTALSSSAAPMGRGFLVDVAWLFLYGSTRIWAELGTEPYWIHRRICYRHGEVSVVVGSCEPGGRKRRLGAAGRKAYGLFFV